MKDKQPTAFTIGHSHHPIWFVRYKLLQNQIDLLVDCRTFPQSRFSPQFNRRTLQRALEEKSINYLWFGRRIGGRGINDRYEEAIEELADLVRSGVRICLMCSEASPEKCHRHLLLEPSFAKRGIKLIHILCDDAPKKRPKPRQRKLF